MKVWAIFKVANQYYQPENDLVALFINKPSITQLSKKICGTEALEDITEVNLIALVEILRGNETKIWDDEYRLEEVGVEE